MKTISEIYKEYKIMPTLQEHMLRVAGVASLICDNFDEPLNKEEIISACLLHDMGNIIKFDLTYFPEFVKPEGLEYWQKIKKEYIEKYGIDEHLASEKIVEEFEVSDRILELIQAISILGAMNSVSSNDFGKKIVEYCDDRVTPFGVVSMEQRLIDLGKRYTHHDGFNQKREVFENTLRQIEKQIFAKCKIKPEDINDDTVKSLILKLKDFVIK